VFSIIKSWWIRTCESILKKTFFGVLILAIGVTFFLKDNHHKYFSLYQLYEGYDSYLDEVVKYKRFLSQNINNDLLSSVSKTSLNNSKETIVLIIGESTTRNHLGIYNYYRNTTPNLNNLKSELVVFNDVISPHSHTIPSLEKVLTFGNQERPEAKFDGSIIQLMKAAGYKTFWVSNQVPVGVNETMVSMIAKPSDYTHFTNLGGAKELRSLDERIFPYFKKVVRDTASKKFIIVHLLGTHTNYKNRYPKKYNFYSDIPQSKFPSETSFTTINEYDNSIRYNDYIISELIELVKGETSNSEKASLIYFSDHGEDVFETVDFTGHSETIGSNPMFQIPFIFWSNNKVELEKYKDYSDRKYMTDDLIYSIADLANLSFKGFDNKKSIFSDSFIERTRIIRGNVKYDSFYKNK
jgi:heptose-I-phosphate ethanolaminephosphotransferase